MDKLKKGISTKKPSKIQSIKILNKNLYSHIKNNEETGLLQGLGVKILDQNSLQYFLDNFENEYKLEKDNSINNVRKAYEFYLNYINEKEIKIKITETLSKVKLLSDSGNFYPVTSLNISKFYHEKKNLTSLELNYPNYSISKEYFEKGEKSNWFNFLKDIGIFYEVEKVFLIEDLKHNILELPYFNNEYISLIKNKFSKKDATIKILVYPFLNFEKIEKYESYYNLIKEFISIKSMHKDAEKHLDDYFEIFIKRNIYFPTSRKILKPIEDIYSGSILNQFLVTFFKQRDSVLPIKDSCHKLLEQVIEDIDFPAESEWEEKLLSTKFRTTYNINDIPKILKNIVNFQTERMTVYHKSILKEYFKYLFSIMYKDTNFIYDGYYLDINEDYTNANDLFYIKDLNIRTLMTSYMYKNKKKELYTNNLPDSYLQFCKKNRVRIYDKNSISYNSIDPFENLIILDKLKSNIDILNEFKKSKGENKINLSQIKFMKIFGCKSISVNSEYGDVIDGVPAFFDKKDQFFNIYYLDDNDPYTWNHSTIIYFISSFISIYSHFHIKNLSNQIKLY